MKLTLVGLPLGNIKDLSLRAIETLAKTSLVICEDTRRFNRLYQKLQNLGYLDHDFQGEFALLTDYRQKKQIPQIIDQLNRVGEGILVSDAGLPTISDPGYRLLNQLIDQGVEIDIIPGPTAAMSSLAVSGFSSDRVLFIGFLPKKTSKRQTIFNSAHKLSSQLPHTLIIYESPYRIKDTLKDLDQVFPSQTPAVIVRELTKEHQQVIRSTLQSIQQELPNEIKGELTLLLRLG